MKILRHLNDSVFREHISHFVILIILFSLGYSLQAQPSGYKSTRDDTLRGMMTPVRTCYDVTYYDLSVSVDVKKRFISGSNVIYFKVINDFDSMQIDLFARMKIDKILFNGSELKYRRDNNSIFISFPGKQRKGMSESITVTYSGYPMNAKR